jgi:hypothetical protein
MSNPNLRPSDRAPIVAVIDPDVLSATEHESGWVDMNLFPTLMAIILLGTMEATATVDAWFEQATDDQGAGAKVISPAKELTQLTQAGTDASDSQAVLVLRDTELDRENGFRYAKLSVDVNADTVDGAAVVLGLDAKYPPGTDLTTVAEVVGG